MNEPRIDVQCPQCGFEFQLPVGEAVAPLIDREVTRRANLELQKSIDEIRTAAQSESDERNFAVLSAKDKIISDMRVQIEELRRKADSGTQLLAGEAREVQVEQKLKAAFPSDRIVPVAKGRAGGDVLQEVVGGQPLGAILWEVKNTKTWSNDWLPKIKQDMRAAKAAICVIVTTALPRGVDTFDRIGGVFVVTPRCVLPLAQILRQVLIEIAVIRAASQQGDGATTQLIAYLAGGQFRNRVLAILEGCVALQSELDTEKRGAARRWARTQQQIDAVVQGIGGIYGDIQGLVGSVLPELAGVTVDVDSNSGRKAS